MSDPVRASDVYQWGHLLAKAATATQSDLAVCATTGDVGGTPATALMVCEIGGGGTAGGGPETVTVRQGSRAAEAATSRAWYVSEVVKTDYALSAAVSAVQSGAWTVNANVTGGNVGVSSIPAVSAVQSGAWTIDANITAGNVGVSSLPSAVVSVSANPSQVVSVSAIPSIVASVSANPSQVVSVSAIPAVSAVQSGAWTANVSVSANVSQSVSVINASGTDAAFVQGNQAHDGTEVGNPVGIGFSAATNLPAAVASNDRVKAIADIRGRGIFRDAYPGELSNLTASATGTGSVTLVAAPGANIRVGMKGLDVFNGGTDQVTLALFAGTGTTNVRYRAVMVGNGGGFIKYFPDEGWTLAANSALNMSCSPAPGASGVHLNLHYGTIGT